MNKRPYSKNNSHSNSPQSKKQLLLKSIAEILTYSYITHCLYCIFYLFGSFIVFSLILM